MPDLTITENTNPKIVELYQQLQDAKTKIDKIQSERMDKLSENYQALKENEQSLGNRTLTAATTAATGIGGMELARGLSEQKADKDAEQNMTAYLETFRCEYGDGKSVKGGQDPIELPGGNDEVFMNLRNEYFALAADLKERKAALGMKPGIESEEILDKSQLGLYDEESVGITDGAYASLYRAQMLGSEKDKAAIDSDKEASKNRVIGGAVAAGAGVVGGIVGNAIINKDAPKNESEEINREYDKQIADVTAEQDELAKQLNEVIAQNAADVKKYNENIQQHKDQITAIKQSPADCQSLFTDYIKTASELSPVENETDNVPDISLPEVSDQQALLSNCTKCDNKGGIFDSDTSKCPCPEDKPIEKDGKCVEKPVEISAPITNEPVVEPEPVIDQEPVAVTPPEDEKPASEQTPETENTPEDETTENEDSESEYCPATGNRLKSINDKTKIGDECSSTNIAAGEVIWAKTKQPKTICTCVAYVCNNGYHSVSGRCDKDEVKIPNCPRQEYNNVPNIKTGNDALKFCEEKGGKQCKTVNAIKDYTGIKGKVLCNAGQDEFGAAKQRAADSKLKYYNCGESDKLPKGVTCKFIQDFKREKVTPMEAMGLMKEYALKKYKDDIKCDEQSHRKSNDYRQCASRKNSKYFYEFEFKDLDAGNSGFTDALCLIWGLKGGMNLCKNANQSQCNEISAAVNRTFYIGGSAELKGTNCIINSHPRAESSPVALLNTKVLTKEDMRTVGNIDPLHFYDKKLQMNANSDVYKTITNYLFVEQRLPVKQFSCGAGFVDNTMYYNVSRQKYNETQEKIRKCQQDSQTYSGGGEHAAQGMGGAMLSCNRQYPLDSKSGDLLTCEYDGKPIDFLFKKLDVKWNRKSTAGYQGLLCLSEGGSFTGKSCTLANRQQCDDFNARFKKDYPNSKGMEWDDDLGACVLKDAKYVSNVQKVAEVSGMVALTLVTAVAGGPVVWALSVVEGAALVTEAVTEEKINDWAEAFLVDAARCNNNSTCANGVMKKHIARIMEGSKQFNETQNKQIAKQTERLLGMLDEKTVSAIVDKGESSGYIGEDRDPDLEKSIRAYYGTQLTSDEKRLLTTKKVATVATFATLIGGGIMAGLRQSFKHNLIHISKAKQARWLDLKILKVGDVTDDVVAMSKTGQKAAAKAGALAPVATDATADAAKATAHEMTPAQAKKLEELDAKIAKLESKTNRTADEAAELKKLRQERNTLLNKVGTKDADELAKLSGAAFDKKAVEDATTEYNKAMERRNYVADYMNKHNGNPPQGMSKYDIQEINNNVSKAEQKLKGLGQEVTPAEPLQIGKKPTVTPAETKPIDNTAKPKDTKPAESGAKPKETSGDSKPSESTAKPKEPSGETKPVEPATKKPAEETPTTDAKKPSKSADDAGRVSATLSETARSKAENIIAQEQEYIRSLGHNKMDDQLIEFALDYADDAAHSTKEEEAWLKYHQRIIDYLATKFDKNKALRIAQQRRNTYMNIIANDQDLSYKALHWQTISDAEKQNFLQTLVDQANRTHCNGHSCNVQFRQGIGNATDYNTGNITIELGTVPAGYGHPVMKAGASLDDAMTAFAHEHSHSILLNASSQSSIDERFVGMAILHNQDDVGTVYRKGIKANPTNYARQIQEQEGFLIGETVGKNFESDLRKVVKTSNVKAAPKGAASTASKSAGKADDVAASVSKAKAPTTTGGIDDFLSRSSTLQDLNSQGRLTLTTSSTLNGKQYMRISMGKKPNMQETQAIVQKLQSEGFYVSSNSTKSGEKFIGVSRENIFGPWNKSANNWAFNKVDDEVEVVGVVSKPSASTASKSASKAENVATSAVKAQAPSITDLRQTASKNFDTYLAEAKTSASGKSEHIIPKGRLDDAGWNAINESLASEDIQLVEITRDGKPYMQFVRNTANSNIVAGKRGRALMESLVERAKKSGSKILRADGYFESGGQVGFFGLKYRSGAQCATGLKFHVSVHPDDLERASLIVDDLVKNSDVADIWKVYAPGMDGGQLGKDFTIYVSQNGYNETKIQRFITNLEDALKNNNIKSNGFGDNILSGDKKLRGSNYINYRYDRIDNTGRAISDYNGSYNFVAPNTEYGGDIMRNISVM